MEKPLEEYSKEELVEMVTSLKKQKKFGLVWEDKPEKVAIDCDKKLPVLKEVSEKAICVGKEDDPTHILIEGDNYHALSVLNYTHKGKIDIIYIDPPYNTGNKDFIYNDRIVDREDSYKHSKWLSFMQKRLFLASSLLASGGLIAISIDNNELAHLKVLCDEVFDEKNFIACFTRKTTEHMRVNANYELQNLHDYVLLYCVKKSDTLLRRRIVGQKEYRYKDADGNYMLKPFQNSGANGTRTARPNLYYPIYYNPETNALSLDSGDSMIKILPKKVKGEDGRWLWSREKFIKDSDRLEYRNGNLYRKEYSYDTIDNNKYEAYKTWLDLFPNRLGASALKKLNLDGKFEYSKPPELIKFLTNLCSNDNAIVLDFFAGSGTTAQAVLELNKEDGGNRQCILCTNNENDIAKDVTYPRVKTVITGSRPDGTKYSDGIPANFRYFKTDFVEKDATLDRLRHVLSPACEDMIRIREGAYEKILDEDLLKIYKSSRGLTAIIYDRYDAEKYIPKLEELETDAPIHLYVFSYSGRKDIDDFGDDLKHVYKRQPIPEGVIEIYKKIFNGVEGKEYKDEDDTISE